jgi:outer membrane protein TolC
VALAEAERQLRRSRDDQALAGLALASTLSDLATLVEAKYREARKARDQFDTLHATLALADEHLRMRTRAFEEGAATSLEVVDARLAMARAQLERLVAAFDFDVALAELLDASGQMDRYEEFRVRTARQDVER